MTKSSAKNKIAVAKTFSNICGNLSAGWFGFILISPGFNLVGNIDNFWILTRSVIFGILFLYLSFRFERIQL